VERAIVPAVFWRAVAMRSSLGDLRYITSSRLVPLLGWYDREVAAILFEPERVQMERNSDGELALAGWRPGLNVGRSSIPAPRSPGSSKCPPRLGTRKVYSPKSRLRNYSDFPTRIGGDGSGPTGTERDIR